jgi:Carboxypeptidase regulatory-like domain
MKRRRPFCAAFLATLLLALPGGVFSARSCVGDDPIKPVHRICGVVTLEAVERVANAKITVIQGNKEIATQLTKEDGKFSFDQLKAGHYELHVRFETAPFPLVAVTPVVLVHPEPKPRREIAVVLRFGGGCNSISLVDSKKYDAALDQADAE